MHATSLFPVKLYWICPEQHFQRVFAPFSPFCLTNNLLVCLCFFYLDLLQNDAIVTSRCMHYIFCRGREVKLYDESVLLVTKKERKGKGKWTIGPRMKNGRANLCSFWAQKNSLSCVFNLSFMFACTLSAIQKVVFFVCFVPALTICAKGAQDQSRLGLI